jgi:hypothetical protein
MNARGGFLAIYPAVLLSGDGFPDLSPAAVGGWLRIRATSELTGEPLTTRTAERLGLTADLLAELVGAGVLTETDGRYAAIGMPEPPRKPSDSPEAIAARQRAYRERHRAGEVTTLSRSPVHSTPLHSTPGTALQRVTGRDTHGLTVDVHKYDGIVENSDAEPEDEWMEKGDDDRGGDPKPLAELIGSFQEIMARKPEATRQAASTAESGKDQEGSQ